MQPPSSYSSDNGFAPEGEQRAQQQLWRAAGVLYAWRRFIVGATAVVAVGAVVISLLLPNWYQATARVLSPEGGGANPMAAAFLKNLPSGAASLLGGAAGDYARYIAILSSRSLLETVVDSFNLVAVYETQEAPNPRLAAVEMLAENAAFPIDEEYEFLTVAVMDRDPERAAAMANFFVRKLNEMNRQLAAQDAANFRRYVEARYARAEADLDSAKTSVQEFQQRYGIYNLEAQAQAFMTQVAQLAAEAAQLEIQAEALASQLGPANSQVAAAQAAAQAAQRKYQEALAGRARVMPVPQGQMPAVMREYVDLEQRRLILAETIREVYPLVEQARFQEEREYESVQVVDAAIPPVEKAKPRRSIIVVTATLSAFLLSVLFALLYEAWRRHHARLAARLEAATAEVRATRHKQPELP